MKRLSHLLHSKNPHQESTIHGEGHFLSRYQNYLGEFVFGGIDGCVTTFAVVAGAAGAGLDSSVVIILGFANLIADGFSMSVGSYLSTKSEKENYEKHRQIEYWEVEHLPEREREEVRVIFAEKGFEGELLNKVVDTICADKDRWVDVMMKDELGMTEESKSPLTMGFVTFVSFVMLGLVPLIIYVKDYFTSYNGNMFFVASVLTGICFIGIGYLKSLVTQTPRIRSILETLLLGGAAAALSYYVGKFLESIIS